MSPQSVTHTGILLHTGVPRISWFLECVLLQKFRCESRVRGRQTEMPKSGEKKLVIWRSDKNEKITSLMNLFFLSLIIRQFSDQDI